jgi:NADH-quinone oxidoreductase subunit M
VIYGLIALRQKDLKKLLAYSSLAHVGLIAAGSLYSNLDGLRGGSFTNDRPRFCVGLFLLQTLFTEGMKQELSMKWEVSTRKPKIRFILNFSISIGITNYFNFVGEFTVYIVCL